MEGKTIKSKIAAYTPVITLVLLVGVWYAAAAAIGEKVIFPYPHIIAVETGKLFISGEFYLALLSTLAKIIASFFVALVFAVLFASASSRFLWLEKAFYPLVIIARATPTMSVIFLCLMWFGKTISPVIVALSVIFPVLYSSFLSAIRSCDRRLIEMSRLYKVSKRTLIKKLYVPLVAEAAFADCLSVLSLSVKLVIAAEAISMSNATFGQMMKIADDNLETAKLFAVTISAILLSVALEWSIKGAVYIVRRRRYAD
ncbi:MAG: ABC transporter permease subunit [Clostridia bacterium]|nr:ABC transporter permease subunit [Clostridia bacterium]